MHHRFCYPWLIALALLCQFALAPRPCAAAIENSKVDVPIQFVADGNGEIIPVGTKAKVRIGSQWALYVGKTMRAGIGGELSTPSGKPLRLHTDVPLDARSMARIHLKPSDITSAKLSLYVRPSKTFPYKGKASYTLAQLQTKGAVVKIPVKYVVLYYGAVVKVHCQLRSSITNRPLPNRRIYLASHQRLKTDEHGMFTAPSYASAPDIILSGSMLDRGKERVGNTTIMPARIQQYLKDHRPIVIHTVQPWLVGTVHVAGAGAAKQPDGNDLNGWAEVRYIYAPRSTGGEILAIDAGHMLMYKGHTLFHDAGVESHIIKLKGSIATRYKLAGDVAFKTPKAGEHQTLTIDIVPRKTLALTIVATDADTGKAISGATVTVRTRSGFSLASAGTRKDGTGEVKRLSRDEYDVSVSAPGYQTKTISHITPAGDKAVSFQLTPASG